jgi:hypothetical protein
MMTALLLYGYCCGIFTSRRSDKHDDEVPDWVADKNKRGRIRAAKAELEAEAKAAAGAKAKSQAEAAKYLEAAVVRWFATTEATDAAEDKLYGMITARAHTAIGVSTSTQRASALTCRGHA